MPPQLTSSSLLTEPPRTIRPTATGRLFPRSRVTSRLQKSRDNYRIVIPPTQGILPIADNRTGLDVDVGFIMGRCPDNRT